MKELETLKVSKALILKSTIFIIVIALGFSLDVAKPDNVMAQSCSHTVNTGCSPGLTQCHMTSTRIITPCQDQGANSCPTGQSGRMCTYQRVTYSHAYCRWNASSGYSCVFDTNDFGPGWCGCGGGGGGDEDPEPPDAPPGGCSSCSCSFSCGGSGTCIPNPVCGVDPATGQTNSACRSCPNSCCSSNSCNCTPTCTPPSNVSFTQPNANSDIYPGQRIQWQVGDWGKDSNRTQCSNNSCAYQSHSVGTGSYKIFMDSTNITQICSEAIGTGISAYIPETTRTCTINTRIDPSWPGTTRTLRLQTSNGCGSVSTNRNFRFPPNEKPYCTGFEVTGGGRRIPVTTGNLPADFFAAEPDESFTIRVNAGETDLYGPPRSINLCFALKKQPHPAQWYCPTIANRANSGTFTTTYNDIKAIFANNPYANTIETDGFTVTSNINDNVEAKFCNGWDMYQPTNPASPSCDGGNCRLILHDRPPEVTNVTAPTGWIGTEPDADNGLACVDNNPATYKMTLTDPDGSRDIDYIELAFAEPGNATDTNNDNILDNPSLERKWPARLLFTQKWNAAGGQEFGKNTFWARDTTVDTNTTTERKCYTSNGSTVLIDPTGWDSSNPARSKAARTTLDSVWCMGRDSHSWEDGRTAMDQLYQDGANTIGVDVYYLVNNKTVRNDGHKLQFIGSNTWQDASYVAYERGGNRVFVNFKVQFLTGDDGINHWNGTYNNIWYVRDLMWKDDETESTTGAMAGEWIADSQYGNSFHFLGQTRIDLTPPSITLPTATPDFGVVNATTWAMKWSANENSSPSGLDKIYAEANSSTPATAQNICSSTSLNPACTPNYSLINYVAGAPPAPPSYLWELDINGTPSESRTQYINIGANETGSVNIYGFAQDNACNMNRTNYAYEIAEPWTLTRGGNVFSEDEPVIKVQSLYTVPGNPPTAIGFPFTLGYKPFDLLKDQALLSSEVTISGKAIGTFQYPFIRQGLSNYTDLNNKQTWYYELLEGAQSESRWNPDEFNVVDNLFYMGPLTGRVSSYTRVGGSPACPDANKNCLIKTTGVVNVGTTTSFICDRPTAIFVDGTLNIGGNIEDGAGAMEGCVFIVKGDININAGPYRSAGKTYPDYDMIEGFFISEGIIRIPEADTGPTINYRDGLKVHGSLIGLGSGGSNGSSIVMERNLKLRNNSEYPTYVLVHDPKYTQIAKELFGGLNETYKKDVGFKP